MEAVDRWSGRETRFLRQAMRLTVREFAAQLGVSPRTVSKWEAGGATYIPRPELQAALDTALARSGDLVRVRFAQARDSFGGYPVLDAPRDERPGAVDATGTHGPRQRLSAAAADSASFAAWWDSVNSGPLNTELLFAELRRLAFDYLAVPPEPVVAQLCRLRDHLFQLLKRPQYPRQGRDLHLAAGYCCVLLAWMSGDLGHSGAARTQAAVAALFADTAGAPELGAWIWSVRSKTSFWEREYVMAADQARAGFEVAPRREVRVLLAAQEADACSALGATGPAQAALGAIVTARDTVAEAEAIGGLLSCSRVRQTNYESGVHQLLGASAKAVSTAEQALAEAADQPIRPYGIEAQIRLNLVEVNLDLGDAVTSAALMEPVLRLAPEFRLDTISRRVSHIGQRLRGEPLAAASGAAELRERCLEFRRRPGPPSASPLEQ